METPREEQLYVGMVIKRLSNLMRRRAHTDFADPRQKLPTGMQGWILCYLIGNQDRPLFQRDVESQFNIRRSTATGILNAMEENGFIRRESVEEDGRLKRIVVTQRAAELNQMVRRRVDLLEAQLVRGLTQEEIQTFLATAEKIRRNIEEAEA